MSSRPVYRMCAQVAPSGECLRCKGHLIGLLARFGAVCFWQPTPSGLNLVVAILRDSVSCHCRPSVHVSLCVGWILLQPPIVPRVRHVGDARNFHDYPEQNWQKWYDLDAEVSAQFLSFLQHFHAPSNTAVSMLIAKSST